MQEQEDPVKTVLGNFAWDDRGLPLGKSFLMVQWQDGGNLDLYPTNEFDTAEIVDPKPQW